MASGENVPTMFVDRDSDVAATGHGYDLLFEGEEEHSMKAIEKLRTKFDLVVEYKVGPEVGDDRQGLLLNRVITWIDGAILWEGDPRQVELLLADFGTQHVQDGPDPGSASDGR